MLHSKFQGHQPCCSGEKFCEVMCDLCRANKFCSPNPWRLHMQLSLNRPSGFREDVDGRNTDVYL